MSERQTVRSEYSRWMYGLVCNDHYGKTSYKKLFSYLDHVEFYYTHPMDANRYEDGVNLRYRFGYVAGIPDSVISSELDQRPCSVLEMMIALSLRCEEDIMDNSRFGDRTGQWFWEMVVNLGLGGMSDPDFDEAYANDRIHIFLNREYDRDGSGGALFRIRNRDRNMKSADIWYQMNWYLSEYFDAGNE